MPDLRLPDFIVAGAARSGTTWLYELLDRHPGVWMAKPKRPEPKFFLVDDTYERGLAYYSETWFAPAPADRVCGEKSTNYLESATAAKRIARDLPGVKLIFILREPVARAYSNYLWSRMNGFEHESFADALAREDDRERTVTADLRYARPHAYFSRGLYADQLAPYFARFPREQILCLRFEDIGKRPGGLASRLHQFLGVEVRPDDGTTLGVVNPSRKDADPLAPHVRDMLAARYRDPNRRLGELLGGDFAGWDSD